MSVVPIPEREFNLYALALPEGPNFEPYVVVSGWQCDNARSVGGVLLDHDTGDFAVRVFRRRVDHYFVVTSSKSGFDSHEAALLELTAAMRPGEPPESIRPGIKKRPPLQAVAFPIHRHNGRIMINANGKYKFFTTALAKHLSEAEREGNYCMAYLYRSFLDGWENLIVRIPARLCRLQSIGRLPVWASEGK